MRSSSVVIALGIAALPLIGCSPARLVSPAALSSIPAVPPASRIVGVYEPDDPGSFGQLRRFSAEAGLRPGLAVYYSNWGMPFMRDFADEVHGHGGKPLIQIDPRGVSLSAIASGRQDSYLRSYATQVRTYGHPVVISFGQEMNGGWYPWGAGHVTPGAYVRAWRHIVRLFRRLGARNVVWLWDVNCDFPGGMPITAWWPGASYVTWAGVDCYYASRSDQFDAMFGPTVNRIRELASVPVLVAETAAAPAAGQSAKIADLFAGIRRYKLLGFVWFDQAQRGGPYHQDWRLETDPPALSLFRSEAKAYLDGQAPPVDR